MIANLILNQPEENRLREIARAGEIGCFISKSPMRTRKLIDKGLVLELRGQVWLREAGQDWLKLHPQTPVSTDKMSVEEMMLRQSDFHHLIGRIITHRKSHQRYKIRDVHWREHDMTLSFGYEMLVKTEHGVGPRFSRPVTEVLDGRFMIGFGG